MAYLLCLLLSSILIFEAEACQDSSTSCPQWTANGFCTSTFYTDAQKAEFCALSCNLCSTAPTSSSPSSEGSTTSDSSTDSSTATTSAGATASSTSATCKDANENCAAWIKNGYCSSTFYTDAQKSTECAKSCNLC